MKNSVQSILLTALFALTFISAEAQCTWQTEISDGYEYTTSVPGLIPGKTIHTTPQSYAVHSGTYSLYMNFVNCTAGTGACAGDKIYERVMPACPFQRYRFSTWLTTSFSGTQSEVRITITDKLGNVLNDQLSIPAPYFPAWVQYQSGEVIPQSDTIIFTLYTNVPGVQSGNDLSMDDFLMEKCLAPYTSTSGDSICTNDQTVDLFANIPFQNSTNGTWTGSSALAGGYLGTFDPATNSTGIYIYTHVPFGAGCPTAYDTVDVTLLSAPAPDLGSDTTLCTTQSIILNPGTGSGYTYLWNNGVTGPQVNAFAPGGNPVTSTYVVTVTDPLGCSASDSVTVDFIICTGIDENTVSGILNLFPNPANDVIYINVPVGIQNARLKMFDISGKQIFTESVSTGQQGIGLEKIAAGIYTLLLETENGKIYRSKVNVEK